MPAVLTVMLGVLAFVLQLMLAKLPDTPSSRLLPWQMEVGPLMLAVGSGEASTTTDALAVQPAALVTVAM